LDESTDVASFSQLLAYIRFASNNDIEKHFRFCQPLSTTTTGEDIFNVVTSFLEKTRLIGPNVFVFAQMALQT